MSFGENVSRNLPNQIKRYVGGMTLLAVIMASLFIGTLALITQGFKTSGRASEATQEHIAVQRLSNKALAAAMERDILRKTALLEEVENDLEEFFLTRRVETITSLEHELDHNTFLLSEGPSKNERFANLIVDLIESLQAARIIKNSGDLINFSNSEILPDIEAKIETEHGKLHKYTLLIFWLTLVSMFVFLVAVVGLGGYLFRPVARKALESTEKLKSVQSELEALKFNDTATNLPSKMGMERYLSSYKLPGAKNAPLKAAITIKLEPVARNQRALSNSFSQSMAIEFAERLKMLTSEIDYLAHCGEGRFFILCDYSAAQEDEPRILDRIEQLLFEPVTVNGNRVSAELISGYLPILATTDTKNLYEDSGVALELALVSGSQERVRYIDEIRNKLTESSELGAELTLALSRDELVAHFQPQINLRSGTITGFEALVRWYHPTRGILAPGIFLPLITEMGLDDALGEIMLNQGLEALRKWDAEGFGIAEIGINFSQNQLRNPKLVETLRWELDRFDMAPERLSVEVLENIHVEDDEDRIVTNIRALSNLGLKIDLDDFGTGTASITGLRRFCADRIKIDRSYITDVDKRLDNQKLVTTMINMAHGLGIEALAEGVETEEEMAFLRTVGCKTIQGYAIAKPMSFEETLTWINEYNEMLIERRSNNQAVAV